MTSRPTADEYRHHGDILHDALAAARRVARAASANRAMAAPIVGIVLSIGLALTGSMIQSTVPLDRLGGVVLGGLIAFAACRRN